MLLIVDINGPPVSDDIVDLDLCEYRRVRYISLLGLNYRVIYSLLMTSLDSQNRVEFCGHKDSLIIVIDGSFLEGALEVAVLLKIEKMIDSVVKNIVAVIMSVQNLVQNLFHHSSICNLLIIRNDNDEESVVLGCLDNLRINGSNTLFVEENYECGDCLFAEAYHYTALSIDIILAIPEMGQNHLFFNSVTFDSLFIINLVEN